MVEVPDELMATHIINEAREWGEIEYSPTVPYDEYSLDGHDVDWSLADVDPETCDVEVNGETVIVHARIYGTYSYQTSAGSHWHPPEYDTEEEPIYVTIEMNFEELEPPVIRGELA